MNFAVPVDHKVQIIENEKINKYLDLARELKKKTMEDENDSNINCSWYARKLPLSLEKETDGTGFTVTQIPVKAH